MPFKKTTKPTGKEAEKTLPEALGITDQKAHEIIDYVHSFFHGDVEGVNNEEVLMDLYAKYDDKELLYAVYAYGNMVHVHCGKSMGGSLLSMLKDLLED